jgi:hypothetical protein
MLGNQLASRIGLRPGEQPPSTIILPGRVDPQP